ncbi:SDR family NAD(P)-dependent oxidoreductase [Clostridium felsineum]|uniref:SDR family NAD(P)-dependent oxidoreductase n=1 Tax=Clostridium felsineum TaxID=36839 RepID=UPI00214D2D1B|nr:SDR family NAD(P)-dependent oxidoreductase [Clostridium felsineum]MCR3758055.1 SDR family NAD(P)-dependent oxidoreductase [Clostridium felsineum]
MKLSEKTALITGATSGIGEEFAKRFAELGYNLIITGRRENKINSVAEEIRKNFNVNVEVVIAELSDEKDLEKLIIVIENKKIDMLVNNAGFGLNSFYEEEDINKFLDMETVHVKVPMKITYVVLKDMIKRNNGTIINVSSDGAFLLVPKNTVYASTKAFLKTFTEALNIEIKSKGKNIKLQALCPGLTKTDFHEKMGMDKSRQVNKGMIKWNTPKFIVNSSLEALKKDKVVCIPGAKTKFLIGVLNLLPRKSYYKFMINFCKKNFKNKEKARA